MNRRYASKERPDISHLLHEGTEFTKLVQNGLMSDGTNILDVVVDLSLLVARRSAAGLTRIDALEDAKAAKVLEADLQLAQAGRSADEGGVDAGMILLLLLAHPRQLPLRAHARVAGRLDGLLLDASLDSISHGCVFFLLLLLRYVSTTGMNNSYNSRRVEAGGRRSTNKKNAPNGWPSHFCVCPSIRQSPVFVRHPSMTMMWHVDVEAQLQAINHMRILTISSIPHRYE